MAITASDDSEIHSRDIELYKNITWKVEGFVDVKYQRNLSLHSSEPGLTGDWQESRKISLGVVTRRE